MSLIKMPQQKDNSWTIEILPVSGGFANAYFSNSYGFYGSKNQALSITDCDITDINVLTQGPGVADLTAGTQAGAITELVLSILKTATSSNVSYAIGSTKLQQISATAVTNTGAWPHTITGTGTITGYDLAHYNSKLLYSFYDSSVGGQIGMFDLASTFDDDYWTATISATALQASVPYYFCQGGDVLFITNGRYVATLNTATPDDKAFDFFADAVSVSLAWNNDLLHIAYNRPNISGSNFNNSCVILWNGESSYYQQLIAIPGQIGALYSKNGVVYIWYKDGNDTGSYCFGYIQGGSVILIRRYSGSLPSHTQVGEYNGFIGWLSSSKLILWGSKDKNEPVRMFSYLSPKLATVGTWASPFGTPLISSYATTNFSLAKASGYSTGARYNTIAFDVAGIDSVSQIDDIIIRTEQLSTGAKVDFTLTYNQGKSTQACSQIAYATTNKTRWHILGKSPTTELDDFRLDISWANGSVSNPVKIRSIKIKGHQVFKN